MARHETRPDDPAPWPLLRELGPEFFEVAVRAQVAWHGPTAAWAIAMDLRVDEADVGRALTKLIKDGDVRAVFEPDDLLDFPRIDHDDLPDAIPRGRFVPVGVSVVPRGRFVLAHSQGSTDLWAFALGWLARRAFTDRYVVTCPGCSGLGYTERSWLGSDEVLEAAEASPAAVRAVACDGEGEQYRIDYEPLIHAALWRITTRTWCSSCYGDDEGELGKLELTIAKLIDRARAGGSRADVGVRDRLAVLADKLEFEGDPWGPWIAAHLSGSVVARQEHEAALAKAVRVKKFEERPRIAEIAGSFALPVDLFGHMQGGLGTAVDAMQELNRALAQASAAAFEPMAEELRRIHQATDAARALVESAAIEQDEASAREPERRHGPVGDRLRRRLDRGRR